MVLTKSLRNSTFFKGKSSVLIYFSQKKSPKIWMEAKLPQLRYNPRSEESRWEERIGLEKVL